MRAFLTKGGKCWRQCGRRDRSKTNNPGDIDGDSAKNFETKLIEVHTLLAGNFSLPPTHRRLILEPPAAFDLILGPEHFLKVFFL